MHLSEVMEIPTVCADSAALSASREQLPSRTRRAARKKSAQSQFFSESLCGESLSLSLSLSGFAEDSEAEVAGGCVEEATTREADKAGGTSTSSPRLSALRTKRSHRAMSQISGADLAGGSPATKSSSAEPAAI